MLTYQSLDEIYQQLDAIREKIVARVENLTPEQAEFRADAAAWSASDVIEHLGLTEKGMARIVAGMLAQAPAGDGFQPFSLAEYAAQAAGQKFQAPALIAPGGQLPLAAGLEQLRQSRAAIHELRPRVAAANLSQTLFPHPAFGPLNGYQWLAFIGLHEMRHGAQLKRILELKKDD